MSTIPNISPTRMTEKQLHVAVVQMARLFGYRCYHTTFSIGSERGFPDLILVCPPRLIAVELKRDGKRPTAAQAAWLADLAECEIETYVWTPADWHAGTIEEVLR